MDYTLLFPKGETDILVLIGRPMLGKILPHQLEFLVDYLDNLPDGAEYNMVHLGLGHPLEPIYKLDSWAYKLYDLQRRSYTHTRGYRAQRLVKKLHVIFSDVWYKPGEIESHEWKKILRSEITGFPESLLNDDTTGKQEYRNLDVMKLDLPPNSVAVVVAIGLFSKHGVPSVWQGLFTALSEISRVLQHGRVFLTLKQHFHEFSEISKNADFLQLFWMSLPTRLLTAAPQEFEC